MRMRHICLIAALAAAAPALADSAPPAFVPFTVTEDDIKALDAQIQELPIKTLPATQVMSRWITSLEHRAIEAKKAADDAKPKDEPKP